MMTEPKTDPGIEPTVFVVDDDEAVRESLRFLLSTLHYQVRAFATAEDFLEAISSDQAGCVVLDINLPGMSGFELQARLEERRIGLPVIFITGKGSEASRARASKTNALGYVEKPLDDEVLLPLVRIAMKQGVTDR